MTSLNAHPLSGHRIVVTRAKEQASEWSDRLTSLGAEVLTLPLIQVSPEISKQDLADALLELGGYDWLVFTSTNGVRYFFAEFFRLFEDIRSLGLMRLACVGDGTAEALAALHLKVECQPKVSTAEALAGALVETGSLDNAKILVVTGNLNRDVLVEKLEAARAIVDRLQVYKTEPADLADDSVAAEFRMRGASAMLFASSSAVDSYISQLETLKLAPAAQCPLMGSIGPQTSATMKRAGLPVDFAADTPNLDAFVAALVKRLRKKEGARR